MKFYFVKAVLAIHTSDVPFIAPSEAACVVFSSSCPRHLESRRSNEFVGLQGKHEGHAHAQPFFRLKRLLILQVCMQVYRIRTCLYTCIPVDSVKSPSKQKRATCVLISNLQSCLIILCIWYTVSKELIT